MKILFVITEMPPIRSGVARIGGELVAGYRAAGHDVEVVDRRAVGELSLGEARLSWLPLRWRKLAARLAHCDLVHLHGPAPAYADVVLFAFALRRRARPPLLYSHNFELHFPGILAPFARLYERATLRLAARAARRIVVSSEQLRAALPESCRSVVIPWGCDHRPPPAPDARRDGPAAREEGGHALRVLFVGQMRPYKGVPVLLAALDGLDGVEVVLAGGGRRLDDYRRRARRVLPGNGSRIELLGPIDDERLDRLYARSDVVVLPSVSRQEAFGLVLLEGMRAGCVPLASRLPGVAEVVGDAGVLVPPGDARALRAALELLRDDPERRYELAQRARRRAAERTWAKSVDSHVALACELVAASPPRITAARAAASR